MDVDCIRDVFPWYNELSDIFWQIVAEKTFNFSQVRFGDPENVCSCFGTPAAGIGEIGTRSESHRKEGLQSTLTNQKKCRTYFVADKGLVTTYFQS